MVDVVCTQCGKKFKTSQYRASQENVFCNRDCYFDWRRRFRTKLKCRQCRNEFEIVPSGEDKAFCNMGCRNAWMAEQRGRTKCAQCGKEIFVSPAQIREFNFCNKSCFGKWKHENWQGETAPQYTGRRISICQECGKEFERNNPNQKTCSVECAAQYRSKHHVGQNANNWQGGDIIVECAACGKQIKRSRNQARRSKKFFCDSTCRGKWMSKNIRGKNHPNWKGGWDYDYGPNWEKQKAKALKRDKHTCQMCGLTKYDIGRNPDVHHIKPFREFGYVSEENDNYLQANHLKNLITLCSACHRIAEANGPD